MATKAERDEMLAQALEMLGRGLVRVRVAILARYPGESQEDRAGYAELHRRLGRWAQAVAQEQAEEVDHATAWEPYRDFWDRSNR